MEGEREREGGDGTRVFEGVWGKEGHVTELGAFNFFLFYFFI